MGLKFRVAAARSRFVLMIGFVAWASLQAPDAFAQGAGFKAKAQVQAKSMVDVSKALAVPAEQLATPGVKVLTPGGAIDPVTPGATVAPTAPIPVLAQRTGSVLRAIPAEEVSAHDPSTRPVAAYALPIKFRGLAQMPGGAAPRPVDFEAVVIVLNALKFREASRRFEADLIVGLRNPAAPKDRSTLAEAVKVLISADADEVTPSSLEISRLGDPIAVRISSISPSSPFKVLAKTLLDEGDSVEVPVVRPKLTVATTRGAINGWGLEKTTVQIQADGIANAKDMRVAVHTSKGDVKPADVQLGADGHASVEIRSEGVGDATISAIGVPFETGSAAIEFQKPWDFLLAALLGAIAGWVVRTRARSKSLRSFATSLAWAAIVTAAYSIGIRLVQWAPEATVGEGLHFFVAAMGAYLGVKAIQPSK